MKYKISHIILIGAISLFVLSTICFSIAGISSDKTKTDKITTTKEAKEEKEEPKIETKTETKTEFIDFQTETVEDGNLEYGKTETRTAGSKGEKTYTYKVTYENGKATSRELISEEITKNPINKVIAKGTKIVWHCVDATSYDKNPYNDNKCTSSTGEVRYVSDSQSRALDPSYSPGQSGHSYYNSK